MLHTVIDPSKVRDLAPLLLDAQCQLNVVPASALAETSREERAYFGVRHGIYGLLTVELLAWLREFIDGRSAIEIGSGHGRLAAELGIPATDNRQQEDPLIRAYYEALNQPVIRYGANVEKLDALSAVKKYQPQVVVASWVTHKWDPRRHEAGGNQDGVVEEEVIEGCEHYVFIGNERVHAGKSIWALAHRKETPPWLFSRATNGSADFIAVWEHRRQR